MKRKASRFAYVSFPVSVKPALAIIGFLLCSTLTSQAQGEAATGKITAYAQKAAAEKLYLHLDRPLYLVGETLWFKVYYTDEQHRLADLSKVAYLEILDNDNNTVVQAKVSLKEGIGSGAIQLPTTAASGNYLVRAYTNWMKNFSPEHFFETGVTLINPFLPADAPADMLPVANTVIGFFPEGGALVAGLENKVAFRAVDSQGKGLVFQGKIYNQRRELVTSFTPRQYGLGHFLLKPVSGDSYQAEWTDAAGKTQVSPLPAVAADGYAVQVTGKGDKVQVTVQRAGNAPGGRLHLLVYKGTDSFAGTAPVTDNKALFELDKKQLKAGVNSLVLFTDDLKPVAERLWFNRPARPLLLQAATPKTVYSLREKINLELTAGLPAGLTSASVAVYLTDSLPELPQADIESYLLLTSDLKGKIEDPGYYFREVSDATDLALDDVMLTHGWRRYQWNTLLSDPVFQPAYLPEYYEHLITGKIVDAQSGAPLLNHAVFAASPSSRILPFVGMSDAQGRFLFETKGYTGPRELVVQPNLRNDSTSRITIDNPFSEMYTRSRMPVLALRDSWKQDILKRSINMQTWNSYFPKPRPQTAPDSTTFYGKPDFRYYLDDYTRFPTMEEVMREYIPAVLVRIRQGNFHFKVLELGLHTQVFNDDPLILLDGVPVFDTDRIIRFDPLKMKRVDVLTRQYYIGELAFPGVVSYSTYGGDLSDFEMDPRALILSYEGTLQHREFYKPDYERPDPKAQRIPDFRNLLFWSPSVTLKGNEKQTIPFFASDQEGTYRIVVQGLSQEGIPGSATSVIRVTK